MNEYISREDLYDWAIGEDSVVTTKTDDLLWYAVEAASRMFDGTTKRVFYPRTETRYYDMPRRADCLRLDDDLLAVSSFTTQNDGETVTDDEYYLMCGGSYNFTPYDRIVMISSGTRPNLLWSATPQKSQKVVGTWGYHEDWSNAWVDSQDTVQDAGGINASVTTVTVSNVDGVDLNGIRPRFKVQQTIKIGTEYMFVSEKSTANNKLTVQRGVNGTTAAAHDNGTAIYVYRPMDEVQQAIKTLAKWIYDRRQTSPEDELGSIRAGGVLRIPAAAPAAVLMAARRFARVEVG